MSNLLAQSADDRSQVQAATQNIAACTDLFQAEQTLVTAAGSRQTLLNGVGQLQVGQLPNSAGLLSNLSAAWQNSVESDNSYANWASNEDRYVNGCILNDTNNAYYQAAQSTDAAASSAKQTFVSLWNPIASQYGLPQVSANQI
jgi:hypothetical protein